MTERKAKAKTGSVGVRAETWTYLRGRGKRRSRFPEGMTERKAKAKTGSVGVRAETWAYLRGRGKRRSRFPEGMTERKAKAKAGMSDRGKGKSRPISDAAAKAEADSQRE
jgi:hypothetical protein